MAERLTEYFENGAYTEKKNIIDVSDKVKFFDNGCVMGKAIDKLARVEDILEKYGIDVEEIDDLIANYRTSPILTEEMIKEIAVNEQRKVIQSMIKEITEKECNQLYIELNTWKRACELMARVIENIYPEPFYRFTEDIPNYFYQQAKKENESK